MVSEIKTSSTTAPQIGMVVSSRMGRDKDKFFLVAKIVSPEFVMLVDGKYRKFNKPKLKRWKHTKFSGLILDGIATKLKTDKKVFDSEVYKGIKEAIGQGEEQKITKDKLPANKVKK
ncbi:MAG: KOW domain-containing RNA-binding protein [Firmicutes bacterium]|nr:KOW domain-containing RNA-binding protein [Bacillota bacterium]